MRFSGSTYDHDRDGKRLGKQQIAVVKFMVEHRGQKFTLRQISNATGAPEASVSARLRDMWNKLGIAYEKEYVADGLWVYWVPVEEGQLALIAALV